MKRLALLVALLIAAEPAVAQTGDAGARAEETFDAGREAAETGRYDRARDIWARLAGSGDADSQNALGYIYQKGLGVLRDYRRALDLYTAAAEQGHSNAANSIGFMYSQGQGVPRDYVRAYSWFSIATILGEGAAAQNRGVLARAMSYQDLQAANEMSLKAVARIARRMSPEQVARARERAERFLADRQNAAAQNAAISVVPRTRLEGAPEGLVEVPDDGSTAVFDEERADEPKQTGPQLPSLTPLAGN